jgi:uncharacterized membrane protein YjjB (DUF3815 family)
MARIGCFASRTLNVDVLHLCGDSVYGAIAAAGFAVLFNIGLRVLPLCATSGAVALAMRDIALAAGWRMEAASFTAALAVGLVLQLIPSPMSVSRSELHVVGCIPMVPGGFATKAVLALFALTAQNLTGSDGTLAAAVQNGLRVTFTMCAIGVGLSIPSLVFRSRQMP